MKADQIAHGTVRGHAAHLELRIPICDACRTALNEYRRSMPGIVAYKRRYGRATSRALSRLKVAHREEFARFFHEELAKVMTEADEDGLLPEYMKGTP